MRIARSTRRILGVTLASTLAIGGVFTSTANAAPTDDTIKPMACIDKGWHYSMSGLRDKHLPTGTHWKSGPGGQVEAAKERSQTASLSVSMGVSVSASTLVVEAEQSYGINASVSTTRSETYKYSRNISSGKYGHLQFGNWGWGMNVRKYYVNHACDVTKSYRGTVNKMPSANTWGYRYWETRS